MEKAIMRGVCRAHEVLNAEHERWVNQIRAEATDIGGSGVWIEKVLLQTTLPVDLEKLASSDSPVGDLLRLINKIEKNPEELSDLVKTLSVLKSRLPIDLRHGEDAVDIESPERLREIIADAKQILLPQFMARSFNR